MNQQNYDKLKQLRLSGMAEAYETLLSNPAYKDLTFDELLGIMIDQEDSVRKSNKLNRLLKQAQFTVKAAIEDIQYDADRKLDRELLMKLSAGDYILDGRNIIFKGVSGAGKTWLATAFGVQACRQFYTVRYTRLPNLLEEFKIATHQADGSYTKLMKKLINARYEAQKSNIYCSQFDFPGWYEKLGDGTLAEAILDRIIHNSYDVLIDGDISMREKLGLNQDN